MGGSAQRWSVDSDAAIAGAKAYQLRLAMTKFDGPAVTIRYEIAIDS